MAGRRFIFDPPDRFVAGAVGEPGRRTFFLQASKGSAVLSLGVEKIQVAALAERIGELTEALVRQGVEVPASREAILSSWQPAGVSLPSVAPSLREPVVEAFRVGAMTIAWDDTRRNLVIEAFEIGDEPAEPEDGPGDDDAGDRDDDRDVMRVRFGLGDARTFAEGAMAVVAAGRPPCPICGEPLDPQGHICLRRNGYVQ
jgi:uncharacterized repeat protein (TIGR03847 family)